MRLSSMITGITSKLQCKTFLKYNTGNWIHVHRKWNAIYSVQALGREQNTHRAQLVILQQHEKGSYWRFPAKHYKKAAPIFGHLSGFTQKLDANVQLYGYLNCREFRQFSGNEIES